MHGEKWRNALIPTFVVTLYHLSNFCIRPQKNDLRSASASSVNVERWVPHSYMKQFADDYIFN